MEQLLEEYKILKKNKEELKTKIQLIIFNKVGSFLDNSSQEEFFLFLMENLCLLQAFEENEYIYSTYDEHNVCCSGDSWGFEFRQEFQREDFELEEIMDLLIINLEKKYIIKIADNLTGEQTVKGNDKYIQLFTKNDLGTYIFSKIKMRFLKEKEETIGEFILNRCKECKFYSICLKEKPINVFKCQRIQNKNIITERIDLL